MIALRRGATELSHEDYMEGLWWSCDCDMVFFLQLLTVFIFFIIFGVLFVLLQAFLRYKPRKRLTWSITHSVHCL